MHWHASACIGMHRCTVLGLLAAYYRGWTERIIMRLMDVLFAFPVMLLAIGVIAVMGPGAVPTAAAIAIVYTPSSGHVFSFHTLSLPSF